jgi:hypothetical protein
VHYGSSATGKAPKVSMTVQPGVVRLTFQATVATGHPRDPDQFGRPVVGQRASWPVL